MPSSSICEDTVLLTPHGWRAAKSLQQSIELVAIDRHGRVISTTGQLSRAETKSRLAFVGTAAAFAGFTADTRIVANDGRKKTVGELIESGDVSSVYFETLTRLEEPIKLTPETDDLWGHLSDISAICDSETIVLRCRDPLIAASIRSSMLRKKELGEQTFAIMKKSKLASALESKWPEAIITLITCLFKNSDDERVEIERASYYLALWFAAAQALVGAGYSYNFDTIQHSSYVFVAPSQTSPPPLQRGACAFYTPYLTECALLTWSDSTLAPVAGGFLLG
jgi:hypothetical protein